jgi:deoxyribonuclease-4
MSFDDLGAHLSVAGGLETCFARAAELGCGSAQIFVKNQRQWAAKPLAAADAGRFAAAWRAEGAGVKSAVAHATYLVNLAAEDGTIFAKSVACLGEELRRADVLGLTGVVVHPGSTRAGREAGIARIAEGLALAMRESDGAPILEGTPGCGGQLGGRFEDLRDIIAALPPALAGRVGVCVDTCHMHVAGYAISSARELEVTLAELDAVVGLARLRAIHVNDSKGKKGSRLDRHANLGEGTIGLGCFEAIVGEPRLRAVPKILETPHEGGGVRRDLEMLKRMRSATGTGTKNNKRASEEKGHGVPRRSGR